MKVKKQTIQVLRKLQRTLAERIVLKDEFSSLKRIAAFDLAFFDNEAVVVGVITDFKTCELIELKSLKVKLFFPYIPTLLAFREAPPIIRVFKKFKLKPDLTLINGHGLAHPNFCGIASHVGVVLDVSTIGIAQNKLCGHYEEPRKVGEAKRLIFDGRAVGFVLKSRENCRPIFISPGHKVSLKTSLEIVKKLIKDHKLPEPLYLAHSLANKIKMSMLKK